MAEKSSAFDLNKFKKLFKDERKDLVFMARTSETAERYEDMCKFMRELVRVSDAKKADLTIEERNLLSVAFKNVIGSRRASWRTLNVDERKDDPLILEYKAQVEMEMGEVAKMFWISLRTICSLAKTSRRKTNLKSST